MADFTIDVSRSKTSRINLGIQGENIIEHIIFNISSWIEEFGEGDAYVYAQRKGDENPYPVALDMDLDAGTATWTLNATDTAVKGRGKAQLVYVVDEDGTEAITDDEIKKTRVFATTVQTSLVPASEENPDAYETWLEVLGGYTARIEAAEDDIKAWVTAQINAIDFPVDDVQIDGTSVVSDGVAEIPKATQNQFGVVEVTAHGDPPGGYAEITNANGTIQLPFVTDTNGIVTPIRAKYLPEATTGGKGAMSAADKAKLNGIEAEAEVNVQSDWNQTDTSANDFIKNKPTIPDVPDIEGTSPINVDDTTDTLVISHEDSGVTPGTYSGYGGTDMSGYYCFYAPQFTVDDDGHLTFASNLGESLSDVLNPSRSYGFIRKEVWAGAVRAYSDNYLLLAGQTSASFNVYDQNSPWTSVGVVDVVAFDASTYEPVMVDWTVDTLASVSIKQTYVTLTVSIAEAYEHDIRIYPTVTYRVMGM